MTTFNGDGGELRAGMVFYVRDPSLTEPPKEYLADEIVSFRGYGFDGRCVRAGSLVFEPSVCWLSREQAEAERRRRIQSAITCGERLIRLEQDQLIKLHAALHLTPTFAPTPMEGES